MTRYILHVCSAQSQQTITRYNLISMSNQRNTAKGRVPTCINRSPVFFELGFGTPAGGFKLRWVHFQRSREVLGYAETIRWLEHKLQHRHPPNAELVKGEIEKARRGEGPAVAARQI